MKLSPKTWALIMAGLMLFSLAAWAEPETDSSSATIRFTAPEAVFMIEGVTPEGTPKALDIAFSGTIPEFLSDTYEYSPDGFEKPNRFLKISDTKPTRGWNVTAQLDSFVKVNEPLVPVFGARLSIKPSVSYRQIESPADSDGNGLASDSPGWPAAKVDGSVLHLTSGGSSVAITRNLEDAELGIGYFFIQFNHDEIKLDNIRVIDENQILAETDYVSNITWTATYPVQE